MAFGSLQRSLGQRLANWLPPPAARAFVVALVAHDPQTIIGGVAPAIVSRPFKQASPLRHEVAQSAGSAVVMVGKTSSDSSSAVPSPSVIRQRQAAPDVVVIAATVANARQVQKGRARRIATRYRAGDSDWVRSSLFRSAAVLAAP